MKKTALLLCALLLQTYCVASAAPAGCDDPAKPWRLSLDPVGWGSPDKVVEKESKALFAGLESQGDWPKNPDAKAVVDYLSKEESRKIMSPTRGYFVLGYAKAAAKDKDGARKDFRKAVETDPSYLPGWCALVILLEKDVAPGAVKIFQEAVAASPNTPSLYQMLATMQFWGLQDAEAAVDTLEKAIGIVKPPSDELYINQAALIVFMKDFAKHLVLLQRDAGVLATREGTPGHLILQGIAEYMGGDYKKSLERFETALTADPENGLVLFGAAESAYCAGDNEKAKNFADKLLPKMGKDEQAEKLKKRLAEYK